MARGGKREGAGRRAGCVTTKTRKAADKAAEQGLTPLDYMLQVLRDEGQPKVDRMWAAEKAAPYVHAKLAAVDHTSSDGSMSPKPSTIEFVSPEIDEGSN